MLDMWGDRALPWLQATYGLLGVGASFAPLIAAPFLACSPEADGEGCVNRAFENATHQSHPRGPSSSSSSPLPSDVENVTSEVVTVHALAPGKDDTVRYIELIMDDLFEIYDTRATQGGRETKFLISVLSSGLSTRWRMLCTPIHRLVAR
jgi:hypothetical protein